MAEHPNATLVRRGFAAFSAGDIATLTEVIAHDAVQVLPGNNPMSGEYKGLEAILGMYGELATKCDSFSVDLESLYCNGPNVAAVYRNQATRAGRTYDARHVLYFTILNGKSVEMIDLPEDLDKADAFWAD
jgi:ketosteroid isomerase-like protein